MNRFDGFLRWAWSILVVCTLAFTLGGCEGDDGATGPTGPTGDTGSVGPEGPPGTAATVTPIESCAVCHSDGSYVSAPAAHALPPIESVSNVAFAVNGLDLDVTFALAADGVPTAGYDTIERGYRTDGVTRTTIVDSLTLADNGGGNYTIKVLGGAAEAANDNRYLFRVAAGADSETSVYLYGDFPASPVEDLAISAEACNACHGKEGIDVHGGYFAAEDGGERCGPRLPQWYSYLARSDHGNWCHLPDLHAQLQGLPCRRRAAGRGKPDDGGGRQLLLVSRFDRNCKLDAA
ncbi:MAG: hypothetical protein GWP67_00965 [Gammaproteobacteria bacterium]|nr:hypothetical protein [Gammaproteobacteria bacterium]